MLFQSRALGLLKQFLEEERLPYMIVGGLAVAAWAEARATRDADVKVLLGERPAAEFRRLVGARFSLRPPPAGQEHRLSPLVVQAQLTPEVAADFLIGVLPYEVQAVQRAIVREIAGVQLPVCTAEDLIIHKVVANRPVDWMDIENTLRRQRGRLDQRYIDRWLGEFAEALEQPELVARYHSLRSKL